MKIFTSVLLFFLPAIAYAIPAYMYDGNGNPLSSTAGALNVNATVSSSNASIGSNGAAAPTSSTQVGGQDNLGNLKPLKLNASQAVTVDGSAVTQPVSAASLPLPTGAATAAKQPALGTAGAASADVITVQGIASMTALKVDGSAVVQPVSQNGTWTVARSWNLSSVSDSVSAVQSGTWTVQPGNTANTTPWLFTISQGGNAASVSASNALKVDGSAVTQPVSGTFWQSTQPVSIAAAVSTKSPVNTNGSQSTNAAIGSVSATTLTAPANTVGFILEAASSNTVNIRWAVGGAATTSSGLKLEPGRDTGFVPADANVSVIAESSSGQEIEIQWVLSQ